jgi:hypothetical protein
VLGSVTLTGLDQILARERRGYFRYAAVAGALLLAFGAVLITDLISL